MRDHVISTSSGLLLPDRLPYSNQRADPVSGALCGTPGLSQVYNTVFHKAIPRTWLGPAI